MSGEKHVRHRVNQVEREEGQSEEGNPMQGCHVGLT